MNRIRTIYAVMIALLVLTAAPASAQMFGPRSLGVPLTRQKGSSQFKTAGTLQWNERFIRANRDITDFVGPDSRELRGFVGNIQGRSRGRVPTMIQGLRERTDRSAAINQPLEPAPSTGFYPPDITLGFQAPTTNRWQVEDELTESLINAPQLPPSSRFAVSVEGRTATLRGEVPSERDRDLAAALLSFEPGISEIDNQLRVNPRLDPSLGEKSYSRPRSRWTVQWSAETPADEARQGRENQPTRAAPARPRPDEAELNQPIRNLGNPPGNAGGE